jgi:hypothetical protein
MQKVGSPFKIMLVQRLERQGIEKCIMPGLLKQLANVVFSQPHTNRSIVDSRLKFLGWRDFELDEHTYQLAIACFEAENINTVKSVPAHWFTLNFAINECP